MKNKKTIRGNIFEALDLANAPELLARVDLAVALKREIRRRGLTQAAAARRVGIDQADLSRILRGNVENVSQERLERALNRLGCHVEIKVSVGSDSGPASTVVDLTEFYEK